MLIALYLFIFEVVMPQIGIYARAMVEPILVIVLTLAGIVMLFGAAGLRISNNLGSTVVGGVFKAIAYITKTFFQALAWIISNTFKLIPRVFSESKKTFKQMGLNTGISTILASVVTLLLLIIVI